MPLASDYRTPATAGAFLRRALPTRCMDHLAEACCSTVLDWRLLPHTAAVGKRNRLDTVTIAVRSAAAFDGDIEHRTGDGCQDWLMPITCCHRISADPQELLVCHPERRKNGHNYLRNLTKVGTPRCAAKIQLRKVCGISQDWLPHKQHRAHLNWLQSSGSPVRRSLTGDRAVCSSRGSSRYPPPAERGRE